MIKQSTRTKQHVKEFKQALGHLVYQSRLEKNLTLTQVSREFGWSTDLLERIEMGKFPLIHFWKAIRLLCFYGKKLRLETDVHISPKNGL